MADGNLPGGARSRPILFSAPMVRALLSGAKTQTRRIVKEPKVATLHGRHSVPGRHFFDPGFGDGSYVHWFYGGGDLGGDACATRVFCPYGKAGDRLWVRESFCENYFSGAHGYRADWSRAAADVVPEPRWTPSIHMPRHASRISLEITGVRAEPLHALTEADAAREGVEPAPFCKAGRPNGLEHVEAFEDLWCEINGASSWDANPWVWVVEFKRVNP